LKERKRAKAWEDKKGNCQKKKKNDGREE